jgi:imidazoleglycerol phosphate dehydratase HisB
VYTIYVVGHVFITICIIESRNISIEDKHKVEDSCICIGGVYVTGEM